MNPELLSTLILLLLSCLVFAVLDLFVSGILTFAIGVSFKKLFCWGLLSLLVPPAVIAYGMLVERNIARVRNVELTFSELPESFDGYRLVQLSDIHSRSFSGRNKTLGRFVNKVNNLNADLIAFTGDIITLESEELEYTMPQLRELKARDGVVSVLGNHDYGVYMDPSQGREKKEKCVGNVIDFERRMGWNILLDDNILIKRDNDSIAVIGVENTTPSRHFQSRGNLAEASEGTDGMFRILLSHDPMHWDMEIIGKDYPLTLSGHTHAVQFSLFGWCPSRYMFKQYKGLYENGSQKLYVNIGLGETIFPARIGAAPEITLITLKKK